MANCCINSVAFIAENDEALPELERLRDKLVETRKIPDGGYLYTVLQEHSINPDNLSCRGEILDIGEIETTFVEKLPCFTIGTETAWSPTSEAWEAILEKYKGIFTVYTAEELGNGIFINTDVQGYCFTDRYRFECYFGDKEVLSRTNIFGIGERFYDNHGDINGYYDSDTDIIAFFSMLTDRKFFSLTQIRDFCESIFLVTDSEISISLNEFSME